MREVNVLLDTLVESLDSMLLFSFLLLLLLLFCSSLIFFAEQGDWDEELGYYVRDNEVGQVGWGAGRGGALNTDWG